MKIRVLSVLLIRNSNDVRSLFLICQNGYFLVHYLQISFVAFNCNELR